ncbi:RagB/SusD family nutrient uptake outer membrane protein, partial [Bacteroides salyersiae]
MKRINIIYLFLMLAVFGSCLDEDPKYTTNSKVVYSDEQSAQMALTGIYGLMAVQGSFAQLLPEINTEASGLCWTSYNTSDNRCQYTAGAIPTENEFNNLVWGALYQAIANCNIFIKACEDSESADWSTKANMVAQAKFMRGVCYYVLYSFYGGVPLRLEPSDRESLAISRATRQQTIDQIIKDWTEAAVDLDETSSLASNKPTAPNKYSAYAYLAKLYWVMGCNAWAAENGDYW